MPCTLMKPWPGFIFVSNLTATKDFDLLWDSRQRIVMLANSPDGVDHGLMGLLKRVDKTFTRNTERTFQAINSKGFAIEVLRPLEPTEPPLVTPGDRLVPMHLEGLDMLLATPEASETVIAEDGYPLRIRVPDPAAYVMHKLWVANRPDRRADKARRDRKQAMAVARLIQEHLADVWLRYRSGAELSGTLARLPGRGPVLVWGCWLIQHDATFFPGRPYHGHDR